MWPRNLSPDYLQKQRLKGDFAMQDWAGDAATEKEQPGEIGALHGSTGQCNFQPVAVHDRHTLAANIIAAHDAAELAIAAIADELGGTPANAGKTYLMDYFDPIEKISGVGVHGREYLRQLNGVRSLLKHQGLYPDAKQWARVAESVYQHVTKWCLDYLKLPLAELDESVLLVDAGVKSLYDEAKECTAKRDYKAALERIAIALSVVFKNNAALRGLTAGQPSSDDAIRLSGFGVHANDFPALQQFLPHVDTYGRKAGVPKWKQSEFGHPGNWTDHTASFCLGTFVDVAIKIQGARWIPGAYSRVQLYDQQIEALKDDVEIWTEVRKNAQGQILSGFDAFLGGTTHRQVLRTLRRGETLRAFVSVATESTGDSMKDALMGGGEKTGKTLSVMTFSTDPKLTLWGRVFAVDVRVRCVPKDDDFIKEHFAWLPTIDCEPE